MSMYTHGYQVVERPSVNWGRTLAGHPLTAWIPKIAWARVSFLAAAFAFNFALWVGLIRAAAWFIG